MSLIAADGLTRTYTKGTVSVEALKDLTVTIDRASFVSFIDPSGSGKTTLLNLIGALDRPTGGRPLVSDTGVGTLDRRAAAAFRGQTIGFIFQEFNLTRVLTAYENVEYPLLLVQRVAAPERLPTSARAPLRRRCRRDASAAHGAGQSESDLREGNTPQWCGSIPRRRQ